MPLKVVFAVYGALTDGSQDSTAAADVTAALQEAMDESPNKNEVVRIDDEHMGEDPAPGVTKHFAAIVEVDGVARPFACGQNQTIDFS